jgi:apolipoprotein D and lipocalin family protein
MAHCKSTDKLNLKKYLGRWYEQGSTPRWFSRGCSKTTATYSYGEDGNIKVENRCIVKGNKKQVEGRAFKTDRSNLLRVGFFPSSNPIFRSDYEISYVDKGYKNAIVSSGNSVWILTREKRISEREYGRLMDKAKCLELNVSEVIRTDQ